jgi:hypothetical protein
MADGARVVGVSVIEVSPCKGAGRRVSRGADCDGRGVLAVEIEIETQKVLQGRTTCQVS